MGLVLLGFGPFWGSSVTPRPAGVSGLGSEAGAGIRQCLLLSPTAFLPKRRSLSLKEHLVSPCPPCFPCLAPRCHRRHRRCPPRPPFPSCQSLVSTRGASPVFPSQILPWDIWLPIHQHPSRGCCAFLLVSLFLCPCCGAFLLYPLSWLLGWGSQGCKTWAGGFRVCEV